ncbi:hypothetical protein DFA_04183 [Cavenderia fasciculata]|uniref:Uncharacterized protein n=1 Tax=Cavenderia fasciculata TaxID=261658 RepID=F4Q1I6_CACFS|nr:uncharacterized protein DFA_04183 [Cavenderia fasciculata]EGG18687.1 hypothetical protein DFA_04183 [Cavenderia fasciculata]|eukprot:XP_004366591.1 hypothetical protein DFA_04183 [Cavenderia fasciculata]
MVQNISQSRSVCMNITGSVEPVEMFNSMVVFGSAGNDRALDQFSWSNKSIVSMTTTLNYYPSIILVIPQSMKNLGAYYLLHNGTLNSKHIYLDKPYQLVNTSELIPNYTSIDDCLEVLKNKVITF